MKFFERKKNAPTGPEAQEQKEQRLPAMRILDDEKFLDYAEAKGLTAAELAPDGLQGEASDALWKQHKLYEQQRQVADALAEKLKTSLREDTGQRFDPDLDVPVTDAGGKPLIDPATGLQKVEKAGAALDRMRDMIMRESIDNPSRVEGLQQQLALNAERLQQRAELQGRFGALEQHEPDIQRQLMALRLVSKWGIGNRVTRLFASKDHKEALAQVKEMMGGTLDMREIRAKIEEGQQILDGIRELGTTRKELRDIRDGLLTSVEGIRDIASVIRKEMGNTLRTDIAAAGTLKELNKQEDKLVKLETSGPDTWAEGGELEKARADLKLKAESLLFTSLTDIITSSSKTSQAVGKVDALVGTGSRINIVGLPPREAHDLVGEALNKVITGPPKLSARQELVATLVFNENDRRYKEAV